MRVFVLSGGLYTVNFESDISPQMIRDLIRFATYAIWQDAELTLEWEVFKNRHSGVKPKFLNFNDAFDWMRWLTPDGVQPHKGMIELTTDQEIEETLKRLFPLYHEKAPVL